MKKSVIIYTMKKITKAILNVNRIFWNRKLEDNWRRKNKNQILTIEEADGDTLSRVPTEKEKYMNSKQKMYVNKIELNPIIQFENNFSVADLEMKKMKSLGLLKNIKLEASGRINEKNIAEYGKTGVDMISVGEVTNSVNGVDLSLEI